jgi:serine/threonine protein kinase
VNAVPRKTLGRFELLRVLGKGAMGIVYEGRDPKLGRTVAIKTILRSAILDEEEAREYAARFMREAQAVARLTHPNIVGVYDFGEEDDISYIVMEFIRGRELKDYLDNSHRFEFPTAIRIMTELLDALGYAHQEGVIHRDIKPANIMLDASFRVKLTDFGVARITESAERTQMGTMVGTPSYMSPEQIRGESIDNRTDLFAAGVILYQLMTGQKPFGGAGTWTIYKQILEEDPRRPTELNTGLPAAIDRIVLRALAKKKDDRYRNSQQFSHALNALLRGEEVPDREADFDPDSTQIILPGAVARNDEPSVNRRPEPPAEPSRPSVSSPSQEVELEFWRSIKDSSEAEDYELYLQQFPKGVYADLARRKAARLRGSGADAAQADSSAGSSGLREAPVDPEAKRRDIERRAREEAERVRQQFEDEQRRRQEEEAKRRAAEDEARRRAEAEAESRKRAEEEAARAAQEEERRRREAEEAQRRAEDEERRRKAEEARRNAEQEARRKQAELEAKRKADEERQRLAEEAKRKEDEARQRAEIEAEARRKDEEARRKAEEDRRQAEAKRREEEARRKAEAQRKELEARRLEEEAKRKADETRRLEEEARRKAEAQRKEEARRLEEEAKRKAAGPAPAAESPAAPARDGKAAAPAAPGGVTDFDRTQELDLSKLKAAPEPASVPAARGPVAPAAQPSLPAPVEKKPATEPTARVAAQAPEKSGPPIGLIAGGIAAIAVVAGGAFFAMRPSAPPVEQPAPRVQPKAEDPAKAARDRAAEEEARRKADEAAAKRRAEEEARQRAADEAAAKKAADAAAEKAAEEARRKGLDEAAAKKASEAAARKAAEEEGRRAKEAEAKRRAAEEEARKKALAAEEEARKRAAAEAAAAEAKRRAEEEARARAEAAAAAEAKRKAAEAAEAAAAAEAKRKAAEAAAAAEAEAKRKAAEAAAAAAAEAKRKAAEAAAAAEAEAKRKAAEAAAQQAAPAGETPAPKRAGGRQN